MQSRYDVGKQFKMHIDLVGRDRALEESLQASFKYANIIGLWMSHRWNAVHWVVDEFATCR